MNQKKQHENKGRKAGRSTTIISSAISLLLISTSSSTIAEEKSKEVMAHNPDKEQCAGIVKAGLNDCASAEHACAGLNTDDGYESDWVWLPTGTCKKIKKAHIIHTVK